MVVVGSTTGSINLAGTPYAAQGGWDAFVVRMNPVGVELWGHVYADAGNQVINGLDVGPPEKSF